MSNESASSITGSAIETRHRYSWLEILKGIRTGEREALMMAGTAPRFEDLIGWEFAGANSLILTKVVGIRKFMKGFFEGKPRAQGPTPFIQGYNVLVRQNGDETPYLPLPSKEAPKRHAFYRVHAPVSGGRDSRYPNALVLDYSLGGDGIFSAPLVDYLVQVYPDDPDLLLGKAYLAFAGVRIPLSFFVLKRHEKHEFPG